MREREHRQSRRRSSTCATGLILSLVYEPEEGSCPRAAARPRRPTSVAGDNARLSRRSTSRNNKSLRCPADRPKIEENIAVMRAAGDDAHGRWLRALIVILWRAGLRIQEGLALAEADLDQRRGALLVRRGKGGRRREVGMDAWGWEELHPWLELRLKLPVGPLLCVINGPTRPPLVERRRTSGAASHCGESGVPPALRATPAQARPCRRARPRARAADRHPARTGISPRYAHRAGRSGFEGCEASRAAGGRQLPLRNRPPRGPTQAQPKFLSAGL